jgi:hypothetical protein
MVDAGRQEFVVPHFAHEPATLDVAALGGDPGRVRLLGDRGGLCEMLGAER